jgi:hypothetical protein
MTLRELLKALNGVDDKNLDMHVMVSPHSGGYSNIDRVEVMYVGMPVIHLAEDKGEQPPDLWKSEGDEVAAVDPADLRAVWNLMRNVQARNATPGQCTSISVGGYERVCSPGADVTAVWFRAAMLGMLQMTGDLLTPWTHDGDFDGAVFSVAASLPMKKMPVGVPQQGLPFDVQEFVKQIGART